MTRKELAEQYFYEGYACSQAVVMAFSDLLNIETEQLKKILSMDVNKAISLYELANDVQKKTIIELVKQAKFDNVNLDYNLLGELGKLSGINLIDIEDVTKIDVEK